eukprot:Lankesteria_metandrocarpae@DN3725_c0_g1_i1.p2
MKHFCEYCDIYLTHSSPEGRRQHNSGRKHISNKVEYFQGLVREVGFAPPQYILEMQQHRPPVSEWGGNQPPYGPVGVPPLIRGPPMFGGRGMFQRPPSGMMGPPFGMRGGPGGPYGRPPIMQNMYGRP